MSGYAIHVKASAARDIAALPRDVVSRILQSIEALSKTPLPFGACRLSGAEHLYRVRVGDYRIVYAVQHTEREIIIFYVRVAVHTVDCEMEERIPGRGRESSWRYRSRREIR